MDRDHGSWHHDSSVKSVEILTQKKFDRENRESFGIFRFSFSFLTRSLEVLGWNFVILVFSSCSQ
jgi:hypothetical protein